MALLTIPTTLTINGVDLDHEVFRVEHLPDYTIAQRDVQAVHVEGRTGDILIDSKSYKNIPRTYNVSFGAAGPEDFAARVSEISKWLDFNGYCELHDTYEDEYFRKAYLANATKVQSILNGQMGKMQIEFSCVPKRFLMYGKHGFEWTQPYYDGWLTNAYDKGDVNGDKRITAEDAQLALDASKGLIPLSGNINTANTQMWAADYDNNGVLTANDAREILRVANGVVGNRFQLYNPTDYYASPTIELMITGFDFDSNVYFSRTMWDTETAFSVLIDRTKLQNLITTSGYAHIMIDCERQTVYEAGTLKNLNSAVKTPKGFPELFPRTNNAISFEGRIQNVTLYPHFWVR